MFICANNKVYDMECPVRNLRDAEDGLFNQKERVREIENDRDIAAGLRMVQVSLHCCMWM